MRQNRRTGGWLTGWVMGVVMASGLGASAWAAPPSTTVSTDAFRKLVQDTRNWTMTCTRWKGTLTQTTTVARLPAMANTALELYLSRQLAYPRKGKCPAPPRKSCKQCDPCSMVCVNGKPWAMVITDRRLRALTLSRATTVQGFPFKAGTRLVFRRNGKLESASLQSPQTLASRKLKRSVQLNRGSRIAFIPAPNPKVWKLPKVKLFHIGNFTCYYTGDQLAMVCTF